MNHLTMSRERIMRAAEKLERNTRLDTLAALRPWLHHRRDKDGECAIFSSEKRCDCGLEAAIYAVEAE